MNQKEYGRRVNWHSSPNYFLLLWYPSEFFSLPPLTTGDLLKLQKVPQTWCISKTEGCHVLFLFECVNSSVTTKALNSGL